MPVNQKKMAAMKKTYGPEKGERVYYAIYKNPELIND